MSFIYILANKKRGTIYIGVTNNLIRRVYEHKNKIIKGFTCKYNVDQLVYYEQYSHIYEAIQNEKKLKNLHRCQKIEIIERFNSEWVDLYTQL